jgi:methyl-CpG-binding domain protein 4
MWIPPKFGLIQEKYWPDGWKILVCCLCLNLTKRAQMEPVVEEMFKRWPTPRALAVAPDADLEALITPLGMQRKRTQTLKRMSTEYAAGGWNQAKQLHGIGKYGDDAYRIFILGDWRAVQPNDHALNDYHEHLVKTLGDGDS